VSPEDDVVASAIAIARQRWPAIALDEAMIAASRGLLASARHPADLLLVRACLAGEGGALQALEQLLVSEATRLVARRPGYQAARAEGLQATRIRLLADGPAGGTPALASYRGEGPLGRFLQVILAHTFAQVVPPPPDGTPRAPDALIRSVIGDFTDNAEGRLLDAETRLVVKAAVHEAIESLTPRERALMRYLLLEGRSHEVVGRIFGVTRTTTTRWFAEASAKLMQRARARVQEQLGQEAPDITGIELSLSRIIGGA
jgi:RNA polymerase sigma-70 factor